LTAVRRLGWFLLVLFWSVLGALLFLVGCRFYFLFGPGADRSLNGINAIVL